jgi:hypothetical protein
MTNAKRHLIRESSQSQSHIATDCESVSLGVEPPSGAHDPIFITVWQLQSCYCGAPSLRRGRDCLLSESLSALVSHLSATVIYLWPVRANKLRRFIREWPELTLTTSWRTEYKIWCLTVTQLFCVCIIHSHRNVFIEPLPSNGQFRVYSV